MKIGTFHTWSGCVLSILFVLFLLAKLLRRRVGYINSGFERFDTWISRVFTEKRRTIVMALLIVTSIVLFARGSVCESDKDIFGRGYRYLDLEYFNLFHRYFFRIFPLVVGGALIAGIIERYFHHGRLRFPSSMVGAGTFAGIIPMCSCAAVPIAHSLLLTKKMTLRAVVTFLFVVPVLNPFVIVFGTSVIGWKFTLLRIVGIFALGMASGLIMERFIGIREEGNLGMEYYSCKGCSRSRKASVHSPKPSVLLATYDIFFSLVVYITIGVAIGAAVAKYLPPPFVGKYLSSNILGLVLATTVGLPIFICSGEEVLILKPLLDLGLPMGHAIAFTLAGNGICFAGIPILLPCFGKKATTFITLAFLFGSFLIGLLINALWR